MKSRSNAIDACQICKNKDLHQFLSLGYQPPSDNFLSEEQLKEPETHYPLEVQFCDDCKLVQLTYAIDPDVAFTDKFIYTTSSSGELVKNFKSLAEETRERFNLSSKDLVIDIGSNDGTLLENYLKENIKVLGIDPSKAAKLAIEKKVPTLIDFFNEDLAQKISEKYGKSKLITATNVFAHVRELDSFMRGVKLLLKEDGAFIEESHYLENMVSEMEYDSIYAEHLRYYSLKPLVHLFDKFGMDVFDVEKIKTHGGSLRVFACKKGSYEVSENVSYLIKEEEKKGLYSKEIYDVFANKVFTNRQELRNILFDIKSQGKRIVGLGAPAKGNTLLNYCEIGNETLDYLAERQNLKIGMYSPGKHIKVVEESEFFKNPPDYALLLAWNLKDIIIPKIRDKGFKGEIIVPVPKPFIFA